MHSLAEDGCAFNLMQKNGLTLPISLETVSESLLAKLATNPTYSQQEASSALHEDKGCKMGTHLWRPSATRDHLTPGYCQRIY